MTLMTSAANSGGRDFCSRRFAFRVFGKDRLEGAFFRPRHLPDLPPIVA